MSELPLRPDAPLVQAVRAIEASRRRIAVVADADGCLLGTLTDGDIRRCLLAGGSLDTPLSEAMNPRPMSADVNSPEAYLLDLMRSRNVMSVPLVDARGRVARLVHLSDLSPSEVAQGDASGFAFAVIMAGGEGMRLRPITEHIPKPMVDIGGAPLLERQVQRLVDAGLGRIYISLNYLGEIIESHFGDGSRHGLEIAYLREREKLGTAGALSLLPERPDKPFIVMNGDILTDCDFSSLHAFHQTHGALVTVAAIDYRVNIPYGVIRMEGVYAAELVEKPSQQFLCNAGIYAVSPAALDLLQGEGHCNMTDIIDSCLRQNLPVAVFPMHEYWSDIGTPDDLAKARAFFAQTAESND